MRTGIGFDLHRIRKNPKGFLILAGIKIKAPYRVQAHSDGDLVLHALSDAIFSALGMEDIGAYFPPGKARTKNMNSRLILDSALDEMKRRSASLSNISVILALESPKLSPHRQAIRQSLAGALNLREDQVGLSFKTFEGLGPFSKNALACWASVLVKGE